MGRFVKGVRPTHNTLIRVNRRRRVLRPRKDGTLGVFEAAPDGAHMKEVTSASKSEKKRRGTHKGVARPLPDFDETALKLVDVVAFNTKAEPFFVYWLGEKIRGTRYKGVSVAWVFPNAAMELNISIPTAKRYFAKHTADKGEFYSDGETVKFREDGEE